MGEGDSVRVVIESLDEHPACEHGPALLFERRSENECHRFYACSAYRNQNECPLYVRCDEKTETVVNKRAALLNEIAEKSNHSAKNKPVQLQKILKQQPSERIYCHSCHTFLEDDNIEHELHVRKHSDHSLQRGISNEQIDCPTTFLRSLSNDKREAQYFFSYESLECFVKIFKQLRITKVVCIGAPRLHEHLKSNYATIHIKSILLDLDTRFYSFNRNDEYFHYNMFNNHFFAGTAAELKCQQFLCVNGGGDGDDGINGNCCIFTDPPFGCRTEPLAHTLQSLCQTYRQLNRSHDILPIFWVYPYFMESYVISVMPSMEMLDYKVNYTNHDTYHSGPNGRKYGSPVRLFTNVGAAHIQLPQTEAYHLCKKCKKWVGNENKHCNRCRRCPSKNGATYVHCHLCDVCVKPTYKHCNNCWRCTQIEGHKCLEYQMQLKCTICLRKGHNEFHCQQWWAMCGKNTKQIAQLHLKALKIGRHICLICFQTGHNENACIKRNQILDETTFLGERTNRLTHPIHCK